MGSEDKSDLTLLLENLENRMNKRIGECMKKATRLIAERFESQIQGKLQLLVNDQVDTKIADFVNESLNTLIMK